MIFWFGENQIVFSRLLTLVTGFILNLLTANLIIEKSGETDYAIFALIASLPALMTFLDFGLGNAAYNISLEPTRLSDSKDDNILDKLSSVFYLSTFLIFAVQIILFGFYAIRPEFFRITLLDQDTVWQSSVIAVVLVCFSTPFTIAYKILLARRMNLRVIYIQGAIPLLTFLFVLLGVRTEIESLIYLAFPNSILVLAIFAYKETNLMRSVNPVKIFALMKEHGSALLGHSLLSVLMMMVANLFSFLPRYILGRESDHSQLVQLSFMLMYLTSSQSIIISEGQAIATKIRLQIGTNEKYLIRKGMIRCLAIALITSLGLLSLSFINIYSPITLISHQQAIFTSIILCVWSLQVIPNFANSQTKNISFFIVLYLFALLYSIVIWKLLNINSFTQIFWLILLPSNVLITFSLIVRFKFTIRH